MGSNNIKIIQRNYIPIGQNIEFLSIMNKTKYENVTVFYIKSPHPYFLRQSKFFD